MVEKNIQEETKQIFCEGVAQCEVSEMSKIFQGCINVTQLKSQVTILRFSIYFYLELESQLDSLGVSINSCKDNVTDPGKSEISKRFACFCDSDG